MVLLCRTNRNNTLEWFCLYLFCCCWFSDWVIQGSRGNNDDDKDEINPLPKIPSAEKKQNQQRQQTPAPAFYNNQTSFGNRYESYFGNNRTMSLRVRRDILMDARSGKFDNAVKSFEDPADDHTCKNLHPCKFPPNVLDEQKYSDNCLVQLGILAELQPEAVSDRIEKSVQKCYNSDPEPEDIHFRETVVISQTGPTNLNDGYEGVGFAIMENSVFRHSQHFDMDGVEEHYKDDAGLVGFEFLDWPGQKVNEHLDFVKDSQDIVHENLGLVKECMQVLEFEGRSDKYLDYICNTDDGLDISAIGLIGREPPPPQATEGSQHCPGMESELLNTNSKLQIDVYYNLYCNLPKYRDAENKSECHPWPVPSGRLYLASGNRSLTQDYVQPLLVSEEILRRLAQTPSDKHKVPTFQNTKIKCSKEESKDMRTVLDFAFSSDRLILGMKCGVILVKNINREELQYDVAYLRSADRQRVDASKLKSADSSHRFPYMVNTVAATPCCTTNKMCQHLQPLVAIYSAYAAYRAYPDNKEYYQNMPKFIYISVNNGDTFDRRVVSSGGDELNLLYWMYAKIPKWQVKDARPPDWVKKEVLQLEADTQPQLGANVTVPVAAITRFILQGNELDKTPPKPTEEECDEIVSMVSVSEENLLLVLCRYPSSAELSVKDPETPVSKEKVYGIFTIPVRGTIPIITGNRRSKRKFKCSPIRMKRYWGTPTREEYGIEPTIVRVPNSYSVFLVGCDRILYYSSNGGRTMFLSSFLVQNETSTEYVHTHENNYMSTVPIVAIDPQGQNVMLTFGIHFAYGVISSNTEITFIVGSILEKIPKSKKIEPYFVPYFDDSGKVEVGVVYINILKDLGNPYFKENYKDRHAIRLLDCIVSIHANALPFFSERTKDRFSQRHAITACTTFNFKVNTTELTLDVGESGTIHVSVTDSKKDTPLNILLTHDKAASLEVKDAHPSQRGSDNHLLLEHAWDITITAKPYLIDRGVAQVSAFFGAEYSNMQEVSAHLIVNALPQVRCHVQPRGHVNVRFGCSKRLVIHEDERRPHCERFRENFHYEIPQGHFDPDMATYWISERPKFYRIDNGTLKITYDYEMFGCPVQPYRLDDYVPDLRLLPIDGSPNTTEGVPFNGSFVLIEIFGASGYKYSKKVHEMKCLMIPQTLERMIQEWKVRVEAIKAMWSDYPFFDYDAVFQPLNIWNRVNYENCRGAGDEEITEEQARESLGDDVMDSPYEVLSPDSGNKLVWDPAIRQEVYIFLAVAVDPYGSFCNHHAYFGVSITVPKEESDWIVMLVFFCMFLFLILLVFAGYYIRRHQVYRHFYREAMFNHLLTAAWNLSFRYEKMLYDSKISDPEVKKEMEETRQLRQSKHSGVQPGPHEKSMKGVDGLRKRLRQ